MPTVPETIKKMPSGSTSGSGTSLLEPPLRPGQAPARIITAPSATPAVVPSVPASEVGKSPF
jgi:hypothetical protein